MSITEINKIKKKFPKIFDEMHNQAIKRHKNHSIQIAKALLDYRKELRDIREEMMLDESDYFSSFSSENDGSKKSAGGQESNYQQLSDDVLSNLNENIQQEWLNRNYRRARRILGLEMNDPESQEL